MRAAAKRGSAQNQRHLYRRKLSNITKLKIMAVYSAAKISWHLNMSSRSCNISLFNMAAKAQYLKCGVSKMNKAQYGNINNGNEKRVMAAVYGRSWRTEENNAI
jgi:hypothetical protein